MIICKNCRSTNVKSRVNYSHGKKSNSTTTKICKDCGSFNIENTEKNRYRKGKFGNKKRS